MLGGRPPAMVAREILRGRNYAGALAHAARVPGLPRRTPVATSSAAATTRTTAGSGHRRGSWRPTLFSASRHVDGQRGLLPPRLRRRSYGAQVVVDIGSNIGISALYFLTRNPDCRVWLYEPVPRNVERLRANLAGYEDRYTLREAAVAPAAGRAALRRRGRAVATAGSAWTPGRTIDVAGAGINEVARRGARDGARRSTCSRSTPRGPSSTSSTRSAGVAAPRADGLPRGGAAPRAPARAVRLGVPQRDMGAAQHGT